MPLLRSRSSLALLALAATALSCGTDLLGPRRPGVGQVALNPVFQSVRLDGTGEVLSVGAIVPFTRVRVVLLRANGDTAVDRMVDFPADADSVSLAFPVTLSPTAPAEGEPLGAVMKYVNNSGDTVFASAPVVVQARTTAAGPVAPVTIPLTYVGPGSAAASLVISPDSVVGTRTQTLTFGTVVRDAQQAVLSNTPVAFTSTDTTVVKVGLSTGVATLVGSRGSALVIAQTLTGQKDTARVTITPTPTAIAIVSGNNQLVRQASAFAQPLRVRVTAFDGLGVANTAVDFAVTAGRGTVSAARVTTDSGGFAQVTWTAGDTAMVGSVVASVAAPALSATFSGTQLSSGPTSLVFGTQPTATIVAGDTIPSLKVVVLDATLDTVRTFAGSVTLTLTGGTAGASLLGTATVNATTGVARFPGLAVNRGGTNYKLVAQLPGVAAVPTAQSTAFTVTAAPPSQLLLLSGGGQVAPGGSAFPDSVRIRVQDRFGFDVVGATVQFSVAAGGGSVAPTSATTNPSGIAATRWTAGPTGRQAIDATVSGVAPLRVFADAPSSVTLTSGGGQLAAFGTAFAQPIVFTVRGDSGRVLAGVPVAFTITGGGALSAGRDTSDALGQVSTVWTAGTTSGTFALTATIPGTTLTAVASGQQASTAPSTLAYSVQPRAIVAGDTIPTTVVAIYNGLNQLLPNYRGSMSIALTGGTAGAQLLGPTTVAVDSGSSAGWFRNLSVDRAGTGYRLVATLANPTLTVTSDTFSVAPAPAVALALTSGGGQLALGGTTLPAPIVVTAVDRFGFAVRGVPVTFTAVNSDASVSVASATTDSLGRASTQWTVGLTGSQVLSVSAAGVTQPLTVRATIPQGLALVGGGGQSALFGSAFATPISFRVLGDSAKPMPGIPVVFSVSGGGSVSQVRDTSDATGLVSVVWTAGTTAGAASLTATVLGMSSLVASASAVQASPAPTTLTIQGAPTQFTAGDTIPPLSVRVLNGLGNVITSYTGGVRLTLGGGQSTGQLVGTALVNAVAGVASFPNLTVTTPGTGYRLYATLDPVINGVATNTDTFTVLPPPAAGITLVSGGGQTAPVGVPFADSVVVRVVDRFGNGVAGSRVAFTVLSGGGTISADSVLSASGALAGRATVRWTAGLVGPQQLRVRVSGVSDLLVNGTAVENTGPPALFIGQGDYLAMSAGQPHPITLYLTSPSPTPVQVQFSTNPSGVVDWEVPSLTIPAGATQFVTELLPRGTGGAMATITSAIGNDSIYVTVDSATIGLRDGGVSVIWGDTVRTQVVLAAPAPVGGVNVTVTSTDSTQVLVAPGTGEGLVETPCSACYTLQATSTTDAGLTGGTTGGATSGLLAPPAGTAVIHIPAGQLVGQVVIIPVPGSTTEPGTVPLAISSPGYRDGQAYVYPTVPYLSSWLYDYGGLVAGHVVGGELYAPTTTRRAIDVTIRTLDSAIVRPGQASITIPPTSSSQNLPRFAIGVAPGVGRLVMEAPGFAPDTAFITVRAGLLYPSRFSYGATGDATLQVGAEFTESFYLAAQPDSLAGLTWGTGRATPIGITAVSSDTSVLVVSTSVVTVRAGEYSAAVVLRPVRGGAASVIYSVPGYGTDTLTYAVGAVDADVLDIPTQVDGGTVATAEFGWPWSTAVPVRDAREYTMSTSDTAVVRVLTPVLRIPAGNRSVFGRFEARGTGTATLSFSRAGGTTVTREVTVAPPQYALMALSAPGAMLLDTTVRYLDLYLYAEPAEDVRLSLTSNDTSVLQVLDGDITIKAGTRYASARVRTVGYGSAALMASHPTFGSSIRSVSVIQPTVRLYGPTGSSTVIAVGRGLIAEAQLYSWDGPLPPLSYQTVGSAGTTLRPPTIGSEVTVRVASGSGASTDTLRVSDADGLALLDAPLVPVDSRAVPLVGTMAIAQVAEVGAYTGIAHPWGYVLPQAPVQTLMFRVVSSDTTIARVEQDTIVLAGGTGEVLRPALVRGMGRGQATLGLVPVGQPVVSMVGSVQVDVHPASLFHGVSGAMLLGMQQRTWMSEMYVAREFASKKPLWVHLTSAAPRIASVPDSVLIPSDSTSAYFPITAGDSVGAVAITATADRHVGFDFVVGVTRTRLEAFAPLQWNWNGDGDLTTGSRTTVDLFTLSYGDVYNGESLRMDETAPLLEQPPNVPVGFVRPSTVPIPVRITIRDTSVVSAVRDTATIPANAYAVRTPGVVAKRSGETRVTLEDRRSTAFSRLMPTIGNLSVVPGRLRFMFGSVGEVQVPIIPLGGWREQDDLMVASNSAGDTTVVTVQSLRGRVVVDGGPIVMALDTTQWHGYGWRVRARGLSAGIDTLVATATGHVPDTIVVEVARGAIAKPMGAPEVPATIALGDSAQVVLALTAADGTPIRPGAPVTLSLATGSALQARSGPLPLQLSAIDGGGAFTCARTGAGQSLCWGDNTMGQLGDGLTQTQRLFPGPLANAPAFALLTSGEQHACGLTTTGIAYCWGSNSAGQLGDGTLVNRSTATAVSMPAGVTFVAITAGGAHTCGLAGTGVAYCWGNGLAGQLGTGTGTNTKVPTIVAGGTTFSSLTAGDAHTCGIAAGSKVALCWGRNLNGQIGTGSITTSAVLTPTAVAGTAQWTSLSAGGTHTCGVTISGTGFCWGANASGQLGDGSTTERWAPTVIAGGGSWSMLSAGGTHTCGIKAGDAYCWGNNAYGQVGDSTGTSFTSPISLGGDGQVAAISAGTNHSCGFENGGNSACWGRNNHGQIGDNTTIDRYQPTFLYEAAGSAVSTLTVQPGQSGVAFWLKGIAIGTSSLTVSAPGFDSYQVTLSVRAP